MAEITSLSGTGLVGIRAAANPGPAGYINNNNTPLAPGAGINLNAQNFMDKSLLNTMRGTGMNQIMNRGKTTGSGGGSNEDDYERKEYDAVDPPQENSKEVTKRAKKLDNKDKTLREPAKPHPYVKAATKAHPDKYLGIKDMAKEGQGGDNTADGFQLDDIPPLLGGVARNLSTQIPAMEQLLSQIPNELLGQFLNGLPPAFQSFIPPGLIPGLTTSAPISLNNLLQLAGGGALGSAANQIMRSLLPGVDLAGAVQQLGSVQLQQVFPQAGQSTGTSYAALANTVSNIQQIAGISSNLGIPVDVNTINQATSIALQAAGISQSIPANVVGLASGAISNPIGTIMNAAMGNMQGIIPVLPSNLSSGFNTALLSGLSQFLPADIAQNLLSPQQLFNALPGNLQNLIPMVSPLMSGGVENLISQVANSAPSIVPGSSGQGGQKGAKSRKPLNDGSSYEDSRQVDYIQMLSQNFSLFNLSVGSGVQPGRYPLTKGGSTSIKDLIKNLSTLSVNVLEPLRDAFPGFTIVSGYRDEGSHAEGKAVDVAWACTPARLQEIAAYVQRNIPCKEVKMEWNKVGWLHIVYEEGATGGGASTGGPGGAETSGLVDYTTKSGLG